MHFLRQLTTTLPAPTYADSSLNQISLEYTYAELQQATRNFDASMKLGSGSYGGVFRGILRDGTEVAIKVLDVPDEAGFEEEVKVLSKFRHPHLVILMGFARHGTQRLLVYEMLAGGDLHKRLQRSCVEGKPFTWSERVSTALDAACGLSHLHHSSPKVFHRDIKTPNILLDKNGTAKMADFGLACLSHASAHRVKQASGTVGYACPLYVQRGVVTEGSEVYSFGMVLLELLTASPPAYMGHSPSSGSNQIQYLVNHINCDLRASLSLADSKAQWPPTAARAVAELALICTRMNEEQRPNFEEIVRTLRGIHDGSSLSASPAPLRPAPVVPQGHSSPVQPVPMMHCPGRPVVGQPLAPVRSAYGGAMPHNPNLQPKVVSRSSEKSYQAERQVSPARQVPVPVTSSPMKMYSPNVMANRATLPRKGSDAERSSFLVPKANATNVAPRVLSRGSNAPSHEPSAAPAVTALSSSFYKSPVHEAVSRSSPILFCLECVFAEGVNLNNVPREQRRIVHRLGEATPLNQRFPPLRVGRVYQTWLFDCLVAYEAARSTISREHFQVWAEEVRARRPGDLVSDDRPRCNFLLANCSGNGTHLNGDHLQSRGEQSMIRHGDIITLSRAGADGTSQARFIQFSFDLSDSCLREAEWSDTAEAHEELPGSMHSSMGSEDGMQGDPVFVLEVCGPAVYDQVPVEQRQISYCPPAEQEGGEQQLYSSLVVGRAHQLDFWHEVLHNDAFNTLSRQHFEVQTWRCTSASRFSFLVRNLSDVNPVHVRGGPEETTEDPPSMLDKNEQRHLLDGDEIVMNLNQEHTFWLIFRDLTASTSIPNQRSCEDSPARETTTDLDPGASNVPNVVTPSAVTMPLSTIAAESTSTYSSKMQGGNFTFDQPSRVPASVLRPPVSLYMKDEDEISTTATPHDLLHEEDQEEEDDGGMLNGQSPVKAAGFAPSYNFSSTRARAGSVPKRERDARGVRASPTAAARVLTPPLRRDSRGVLESQRRPELLHGNGTGFCGQRMA